MTMAMQRRNSAQNYYYFGLLLAGVVFSAVSRRLEPLLVVLPLVIALLHSRLTQDRPIFSLRCQITPLRAFEGDRVTVQLTIRAETDVLAGFRALAVVPAELGLAAHARAGSDGQRTGFQVAAHHAGLQQFDV